MNSQKPDAAKLHILANWIERYNLNPECALHGWTPNESVVADIRAWATWAVALSGERGVWVTEADINDIQNKLASVSDKPEVKAFAMGVIDMADALRARMAQP